MRVELPVTLANITIFYTATRRMNPDISYKRETNICEMFSALLYARLVGEWTVCHVMNTQMASSRGKNMLRASMQVLNMALARGFASYFITLGISTDIL